MLACVCGGLSAAFDWDATWFAVGIATVVPVLGLRDFWKDTKFWITILLLGLAQIPLVIAVRMLFEKPNVPFLFALTICDGFLIVAIILWICPSEERDLNP